MARKKIERTQEDVREYPSYSIDEVADYIGVPKRTLRSWVFRLQLSHQGWDSQGSSNNI